MLYELLFLFLLFSILKDSLFAHVQKRESLFFEEVKISSLWDIIYFEENPSHIE